jgi:hypothetical protein
MKNDYTLAATGGLSQIHHFSRSIDDRQGRKPVVEFRA